MGWISKATSRLTGYERHRPFRTDSQFVSKPQSYVELARTGAPAAYAEQNAAKVVEEYTEFLIGHVEFDDQGMFWDRSQLATIERRLSDPGIRSTGALILVFVHGWKHNARHDDENLRSFRAVLSNLAETERNLAMQAKAQERKIVGIFASWRGSSTRVWGVKETTFWQRKGTAHRVGRGSLLQLLVRLEQIRFHVLDSETSLLIILGHSFGGAAVYSAVSHYIKTDAYEKWFEHELSGSGHSIGRISGFGDLVVLVNPAFEALLYADFNELAHKVPAYHPSQHVVLMTVSAESDSATKSMFPAGQFLGRWKERKQKGSFSKIRSTCGNYDPFVTHRLSPRTEMDRVANQPCDVTDVRFHRWEPSPTYAPKPPPETPWLQLVPPSRRWDIVPTEKSPGELWPLNLPFMMVRSDQKLISGHNGIFRTLFFEYLRDFVIAQDRRRPPKKNRR